MPSEFDFPPSTQTRGEVRVRWLKTQYGGGYGQRMADGPNNTLQPWTLQFTNCNPELIKAIHLFLKAKAQTASSFTWTPLPPFDETEGEIKVTCERWPFIYDAGGGIIGIQPEFEQVVA